MNTTVVQKDLEQVSIVSQFRDVFLDELLKVLLDREVEGPIEISPMTASILCASYRMTPLELKELKA